MHVVKAFVICLYFFSTAHGENSTDKRVRTGNRCIGNLNESFTVQLQCPAGEWIHVMHKLYGNGNAATCHVKSADSCSKELVSSQSGLIVNCNGKQSCLEAMQLSPFNSCNITDAAADVKYSCINGSVNMCSSVTTTVSGSVYLHSPGFLDSVGVNSSCVVRITGQTLQITLLEERMRSRMLNISGDGRQLWTNENTDQYNRKLPGPAAEIVIVYKKLHQNGSYVWIRVAGQMNITITGEILDASTTSSSTQQPSRSQSTSGPSTSDTLTTETTTRAQYTTIASFTTATSTHGHTANSTWSKATQRSSKSTTMVSTTVLVTDTVVSFLVYVHDQVVVNASATYGNSGDVVIASSVVCGILVLSIVVLVIYFMVVKPYRKKHDTLSNTGTSVGHGEPNVYDGIQRYTSDAGDEHNYVHITSSEAPFYSNSVSGDDPYVNT